MKRLTAVLVSVAVSLSAHHGAAQGDKAPTKKADERKAFGFVTAWSGPGAKLILQLRYRTDGTTILNYRGERSVGKTTKAFSGSMKGKLTDKNRTLRNQFGFVTLPKTGPAGGTSRKRGVGMEPRVWGTAKNGLDFKLRAQGFKTSLTAFDCSLLGFDVPIVGYDTANHFAHFSVRPVGGGFNGIVVSRTAGGKRSVTYAIKTSQQAIQVGSVEAVAGKPLAFNGVGVRPSPKLSKLIEGAKFAGWKVKP